MNERIRELAKQADGVFIHKLLTGAKQYTFLEKDLAKFAELIVAECARVANLTEDYDTGDYKSGRHWASFDIKNHFGVEE